MNSSLSNKFELHYLFNDDSHTMDAVVRNKCEAEILGIIKEISLILDIDIDVETEAYAEGGLRERFVVLAKNKYLQGVLALLIAPVFVNYVSNQLNTDKELDDLKKKELRLRIKKLEREESDQSSTTTINNSILLINQNCKVIKQKSNFYQRLKHYPKVVEISVTTLDVHNNQTSDSMTITRDSFDKFIIDTDELPKLKDEEAIISIISPVLKKGNYKWKGIYHKLGESIDFYMKDQNFKDDVVNEKRSFKNGSSIDCVLEISRKLNETGEIIYSSYSVLTVLKVHEDGASFETSQGKKYKRTKADLANQLTLFSETSSDKPNK